MVKTLKSLLMCLIVILGVSSNALAAPLLIDPTIHYVTDFGTPTNSCTNWVADPCDLQTALTKAFAGDQIWVAAGTHRPTTSNPDPRTATFRLKTGIAIYGGFPENGGTWEQRNWLNDHTILSGDIGIVNNDADNSYHVVVGSGVDETAILDGFVITGGKYGQLDVEPNNQGGGVYIKSGSPTLRNITFYKNAAAYGGGLYSYSDSGIKNPSVTNVTFDQNTAIYHGGGIYSGLNSYLILSNVTFSKNNAATGGGMHNMSNSTTLMNVTFNGNEAKYSGGGMENVSSSTNLTNVTFSRNKAIGEGSLPGQGGGLYNEAGNTKLTNVTFYSNEADSGGGICLGIDFINPTSLTVTNSFLWGNTNGQIFKFGSSSATVTYSIIEGGCPTGATCSDLITTADPKLDPILADNGGFTMTHALQAGSPAIDAGNRTVCAAILTDQRGVSRSIDGDLDGTATCDIGAYEWEIKYYMPLIIK